MKVDDSLGSAAGAFAAGLRCGGSDGPEESAHVDHANTWLIHLGRGGDEAKQRMQRALDELEPWCGGLAEPSQGLDLLIDAGLYPYRQDEIFGRWRRQVQDIVDNAGLQLAMSAAPPGGLGGRQGRHREEFTALLDEMCEVYRTDPEAAW